MKFTIGFALLTGLFVGNSQAGDINIDTAGCKVSKVTQEDTFTCPCTGGSGNYDWHFHEIPEGWSARKGQLVAPKGKFEDRKVYGTKVEVLDKDTKQSVKKSLFFSFENGKIRNIVDYKFDFDAEELFEGERKKINRSGYTNNGNNDVVKVKKIFENT